MTRYFRDQILEVLDPSPVVSDKGHATAALAHRLEVAFKAKVTSSSLANALRDLERAGLIERDVKGRRTYRIESTRLPAEPKQALRSNAGKPELSEVMHFDLDWLAEHARRGRAKYPDTEPGVPNWTLGGKPDQEYVDAMLRHIAAFVKGEEYDPELGTHHLAAVMWNAGALLTNNRKGEPRGV